MSVSVYIALYLHLDTILTLSVLLTPAKWETLHLTLCRPKLLSYNSQVFGPYCLHKLTHTVPFPVLTSVSTSRTTMTTSSRWTCLAQSSNLLPGNVVPLQAQEERAYDFLSSPGRTSPSFNLRRCTARSSTSRGGGSESCGSSKHFSLEKWPTSRVE